jgi:hypothetical protein
VPPGALVGATTGFIVGAEAVGAVTGFVVGPTTGFVVCAVAGARVGTVTGFVVCVETGALVGAVIGFVVCAATGAFVGTTTCTGAFVCARAGAAVGAAACCFAGTAAGKDGQPQVARNSANSRRSSLHISGGIWPLVPAKSSREQGTSVYPSLVGDSEQSVRPSTTVKTASHTVRTYREEPDRQTRRESGSQRRRSLPGTVRPHSTSNHRSHKQDIVAQTSKSLNRSL